MSQITHFSKEQKGEIKSIVQEELIPIKDQLQRHETIFHDHTRQLAEHTGLLDRIVEKLISHDVQLESLHAKVDALPTMNFLLTYMDSTMEERQRLRDEVSSMNGIVQRHDHDIFRIKQHVKMA